jgi:hypothetical protein
MGFKETEGFINKLRLIVYGLLAIPLLLFVVLYLRTNRGEDIEPLMAESLVLPVAALMIVSGVGLIIAAYFIFRRRLKQLRQEPMLSIKFNGYYKAIIVKFSLFEAALVLSVAGLMITGVQLFVVLFVLVIFVFSVENPSMRKLLNHLRINKNEKEMLLKHEEKN